MISSAYKFVLNNKFLHVQRELHHRVKLDILRELGSPDKLRRSLDVVEIVLGFLSSGGGKPNTRLLSYLKKLRMEKKIFSEKVNIYCSSIAMHVYVSFLGQGTL